MINIHISAIKNSFNPGAISQGYKLFYEDDINCISLNPDTLEASYEVYEDGNTYKVNIIKRDNFDAGISCTCPESGLCAHEVTACLEWMYEKDLLPDNLEQQLGLKNGRMPQELIPIYDWLYKMDGACEASHSEVSTHNANNL